VIRWLAVSLTRRAVSAAPLCLALAVASCRGSRAAHAPTRTPKYEPQQVTKVLGVEAPSVKATIRTLVDSGGVPTWVTPARWKIVRALYAVYDDAPLWIEKEGIKDRASALLAALEDAPNHALRTDSYPIDSLRR